MTTVRTAETVARRCAETPLNTLISSKNCIRIAALAAALTPMAAGCSSHGAKHAQRHVIIAFDTSASWSPHLAESARVCLRIASDLDPDTDRLTLYRVDRSTDEFFDGRVPDSSDALQAILVRELSPKPSAAGSRPESFWGTVAERAQTDPGRTSVVFFSDGDVDFPGHATTETIRSASLALSRNKRVGRVCVLGASRGNWAYLRSDFASLGDRLVLSTPSGLSSGTSEQCLPANDH